MLKVLHKSQFFSALFLACLFVFAAISFYYIALFHVSPLSRDQWHMYAPYFEGGLWHAALTPMSTHRHLFPFFIFDMDMSLFGGRNHFLILFGSIFDCLIILLLAITLKNDASLSGFEKLAFLILITSSLTWLINIAQLGWGFMSTQYYLAIFTYLFSIYSAYHYCKLSGKTAWAVNSVVCGVISTFSFGMGILVWPALLYFCYMWRAPFRFTGVIVFSCVLCLVVFLLLPGGKTIEDALTFSISSTVKFLFQLAGGPIYYLLKSYRFLDTETIKSIASTISVIATSASILLLLYLCIKRRTLSLFSTLCCALLLVGLGTAALISFTRSPFFLDEWVDRYQIWATLFWVGLLPLFYIEIKFLKRQGIFLTCLLIFPLIALPSQLDMGARLAEYKVRVQQSLLTYQVGIADKRSAEEALHWNWENKLTPFFNDLQYLKTLKKNIYYQNHYDALGNSILTLNIQHYEPVTSLHINKIEHITRDDLLDLKTISGSEQFVAYNAPANDKTVAYQIKAEAITPTPWTHALITDHAGTVIGLGIAINHSALPRSHLKHVNSDYNFYAVIRNEGSKNFIFYFINNTDTKRVMVSEKIDLDL